MDKDNICKFIQTDIMKNKNTGELTETTSLIESGIIDSLGIQLLISHLEKTYKIKISDDEIVPDNFDSIDIIDNFVSAKIKY